MDRKQRFSMLEKYYNMVLSCKGINDISAKFLIALSEHIGNFDNNVLASKKDNIILIKSVKEQIAKDCDSKLRTVENNILKCVKAGILIKSTSHAVYIVSPFFIAQGLSKDITYLQLSVDYENCEWVAKEKFRDKLTGEINEIVHSIA